MAPKDARAGRTFSGVSNWCECLCIIRSSGPRGCSSSRSTSSSRIATSSATSRRAASASSAQLGLHRDRDRTRLPQHRQVRAAAPRRRVSRTARRFGCRTTNRCRRRSTSTRNVRDQILYLAVPLRRSGEARGRARRRTPTAWCATTSASCRRAMRRRAAEMRRCSKSAALRTRLLLASDVTEAYALCAAGAHRRVPRRQAGRARRELHPDGAARSRGLTAGRRITTELLGLLHQRGEALGGRVVATGRGAAAEFADFLMLQAINRYEPLFAHYAESGALHPEELFRACVAAAGELATFTTTSKRPPRFPGYRHDRLRESFDPVMASLRASLSEVLEQNAISIPLEAEEVRHQRGDRHRSDAVQHGGVHPGGARRRAGGGAAAPLSGAAQDRAGREDSRSGDACSCPGCRCTRCRWRRGRFRFTPGSPTSSSIRRTSSGSSSRPRAASPCTSPASFRGWRWSSGRSAAESGLTPWRIDDPFITPDATGSGRAPVPAVAACETIRPRSRPAAPSSVETEPIPEGSARAARHRPEPAGAGGQPAAAARRAAARVAVADGRRRPAAITRSRRSAGSRSSARSAWHPERGRAGGALRAVRGARRGGAVDAVGRAERVGAAPAARRACTARRGAARSSSRCSTASRRIRPATST